MRRRRSRSTSITGKTERLPMFRDALRTTVAPFVTPRNGISLIAEDTARGGATMSSLTLRGKLLAGSVLAALAGLIWAALTAPVVAQQKAAPPDFSSSQFGWVRVGQGGPDFDSVPGQVPPVSQDPAHPFVPNGVGRQPTYRIADLTNPNLKPWVKEHMKKDNEEVLAGKIAFTARSSCRPAGVPGFMSFGRFTPVFFVQSPREVVIIFESDQQIRRVYLDVPHSENPQPSWY